MLSAERGRMRTMDPRSSAREENTAQHPVYADIPIISPPGEALDPCHGESLTWLEDNYGRPFATRKGYRARPVAGAPGGSRSPGLPIPRAREGRSCTTGRGRMQASQDHGAAWTCDSSAGCGLQRALRQGGISHSFWGLPAGELSCRTLRAGKFPANHWIIGAFLVRWQSLGESNPSFQVENLTS